MRRSSRRATRSTCACGWPTRSRASSRLPKLDVKFVPVTSSNRIPALLEGKIDLECGSTTNTRDRQKQVAFAYTTFVAGIKMLAKKSSNVNSVEDLRGKNVVVTKGTTSEKIMKAMNDERMLKINIIESPDHGESFKAVEDGSAIAFPMDDVLLYGLISKSKKPDDFAVVGKYLSVEPYAIMMRKDEPAVREDRQSRADRPLPVRRDPPDLRQVVQHQGPGRTAQSVPQGSVSRAEYVSGVALGTIGKAQATRFARRPSYGFRRSDPRSPFARPRRHQRRQHELLELARRSAR